MGRQAKDIIQSRFTNTKISNMKSFFLLSLACVATLASSEPRFKKLQKMDLSCTLEELVRCEGEIQKAIEDCSHITDAASFQTCLNDILGASDCVKCVCDVVPLPLICP